MFERFTEEARQIVVRASDYARERFNAEIDGFHLLRALCDDQRIGPLLAAAGVYGASVPLPARQASSPLGQLPFTVPTKKGLESALREALSLGHNYIDPSHLLLGLMRVSEDVAKFLDDKGFTRDAVIQTMMRKPTRGLWLSVTVTLDGRECMSDHGQCADLLALSLEADEVIAGVKRWASDISMGALEQAVREGLHPETKT